MIVANGWARGLVGLILSAGLTPATLRAQDQPPPLEPPALLPPAIAPEKPRTPAPAPTSSRPGTKPAGNPSFLVIPGVTAPVPNHSGVRLGPVPPMTTAAPSATTPPRARPAQSRPASSAPAPVPIPLTLEAIADDPPAELGSERLPADRPAGAPAPAASASTAPARPKLSASPRSASILGRLLGPATLDEDTAPPPAANSAKRESRSDPAAEAALKRRIRNQVEQALGDRVRSVEVRISGRTVIFRAHASRFWYRRGVRRTLESMPLPAGYHARVEAVD